MTSPIHKETFHIIEAKYRVLNQYPLPKPFQDASMGPFTSFGIGAICLRDADGHEGEATLETGGATILQNNLLPKLLGCHTKNCTGGCIGRSAMQVSEGRQPTVWLDLIMPCTTWRRDGPACPSTVISVPAGTG